MNPNEAGPGSGRSRTLALDAASESGAAPEAAQPAVPATETPPATQALPPARSGRAPGHTTLIDPRLVRPKPAASVQEPAPGAKLKPVVGWLVITGGPGRGIVLPLHYGINRVGSHVEEGIRLNFGDLQIADTQAVILYDYQRRKFFIHPKGGRVATFLDGEPVLKPAPLTNHQEIVMGRTQLRFVSLCGPEFDWTQK